MELQAIKSLAAFGVLIDLGCRYISSPKQESTGTVSFLTPKGITTIHKNGTIRRSWTYCFGSMDVMQSIIVQGLKLEDGADWTFALNRVAHQVSYSGKNAAPQYSLETMELLFAFAREGKNLKARFLAKLKKLDMDYSVPRYWDRRDYIENQKEESIAFNALFTRRQNAKGLVHFFECEKRIQEAYVAKHAANLKMYQSDLN